MNKENKDIFRENLYETYYHLERAFCQGEGWQEGYGWPVGDHSPETMADAIIERDIAQQKMIDFLTLKIEKRLTHL